MSRSPDSRKTKGRRPASGKVREVGKAAVKAGSDRVQGKVATEVQWITVDEDMAGQRVDNFLLARLRGVPK
ncbi:MAG: 23S rRNA pseudouridine(955/2504/2580) synthase, partial [Pseudomonadota bacterium]|nr:23S rRNA pseudouridine(955/2504/2580) synthase [Pseudomonadota bacterium]